MTEFIIIKLSYNLSFHAGLGFIGKYLKSIKLNSVLDPTHHYAHPDATSRR